MKRYNRLFGIVLAVIALAFAAANLLLWAGTDSADAGRPYRVELSRVESALRKHGTADLSGCSYVTAVVECTDEADAYRAESDYVIREIGGKLYRLEYNYRKTDDTQIFWLVNGVLAAASVFLLALMLYIRRKILLPFERLSEVPYELSRGNLTVPLKEGKERFFGRFVWGVDLLRENLEQKKAQELALLKEKKTLLISLSHDIKTPLSAIKLYARAISSGLYEGQKKQEEIAVHINEKADEIEKYLSQIITASNDDLFDFSVQNGEFYLSELIGEVERYYAEKLSLIHTEFSVAPYRDCLLRGDRERAVEVLQNVMENAVKYGDGKYIRLGFSEEEGCQLVTVSNSGDAVPEGDLPHIFESFYRGANAGEKNGSGLGLYICRQLMRRMNGEIFAQTAENAFSVTAVFAKA